MSGYRVVAPHPPQLSDDNWTWQQTMINEYIWASLESFHWFFKIFFSVVFGFTLDLWVSCPSTFQFLAIQAVLGLSSLFCSGHQVKSDIDWPSSSSVPLLQCILLSVQIIGRGFYKWVGVQISFSEACRIPAHMKETRTLGWWLNGRIGSPFLNLVSWIENNLKFGALL